MVLDTLKRFMSLRVISFHENHIAEWLDHIRETLPRVDVLLPTIKPPRDDESTSEGHGSHYGKKPGPFELSVVTEVEF